MDSDFQVPFEYVRHIAEQLDSRGALRDDWLAHHGISSSGSDDARPGVSYRTFAQLVVQALEATDEPALGLFVGSKLSVSTHGRVGAAMLHSRTVRQALEVLGRFSRVRLSMLTISHHVDAHRVRVLFAPALPLADITRPVLDAALLSTKNVLAELTLGACQVTEVAFPFPAPTYSALARDMFGCSVRYGQRWAGLTAAPGALNIPIRLGNPQAFQEAATICQRELELLVSNESLEARVRRLLLQPQVGFPSLQVVARQLAMTPRTLHRRLAEERTSFREIIDDVRHALALEHVRSSHFDMQEIAFRLGYADCANFRRAFRRWQSVPPSVYRDRQARGTRRG